MQPEVGHTDATTLRAWYRSTWVRSPLLTGLSLLVKVVPCGWPFSRMRSSNSRLAILWPFSRRCDLVIHKKINSYILFAEALSGSLLSFKVVLFISDKPYIVIQLLSSP